MPYVSSTLRTHPWPSVYKTGAKWVIFLRFLRLVPKQAFSASVLPSLSCLPPFSSQMPCSSRLVIPFGDFHRPHHSPISYAFYFDKALPETAIPFDVPHSAYCRSPQNLKKPLLGIIQHTESEHSPGYLSSWLKHTILPSQGQRVSSSEPSQRPAPDGK